MLHCQYMKLADKKRKKEKKKKTSLNTIPVAIFEQHLLIHLPFTVVVKTPFSTAL